MMTTRHAILVIATTLAGCLPAPQDVCARAIECGDPRTEQSCAAAVERLGDCAYVVADCADRSCEELPACVIAATRECVATAR